MTIPSQKLKFQSVEKGLIKSSMNAAIEKRKTLRDELTKIEEKKQQERTQLEKEYEDVALADEIVNKRRNKSSRRASNGSTTSSSTGEQTTTGGGSNTTQPKATRRQSALAASSSSSNKTKNEENVQSNNPIITSSSSTTASTTTTMESPRENHPMESPQGIHSSIPPQYQKLLQLGLSQEQV